MENTTNYAYTFNEVSFIPCFCVLDQDNGADNAVVGPLPLIQDAANQDIRE